MTEHLFPESTTYVHSYPPHEGVTAQRPYVSAEANPVEFSSASLHEMTPACNISKATLNGNYSSHLPEKIPPQRVPVPSTVGNIDINGLPADEREFFLTKTYRTTYDDYSRSESSSTSRDLELRKPFTRQDDWKLEILNSTKPNLAYYGFGLPNQCCVAWGTTQSRTLPEGREKRLEAKKHVNPFPGYPEKMYPFIENQTLSSHYDGSFPFGYTGHQRQFLEYPEEVKKLLKKDFLLNLPRNITTNQANLIYQRLPQCENRETLQKEPAN